MNPTVIVVPMPGKPPLSLCPFPLQAGNANGFGLSPHLERLTTPSGAPITRRSVLADALYRYRYHGETALLPALAGIFSTATVALFNDIHFDALLMVPPPVDRADYPRVAALATALSRELRIPTLQFAVRDTPVIGARPTRAFAFSAPDLAALFTGKNMLVIDDLCRSGRSLGRLCSLLRRDGKAADVRVLVGTVLLGR